MTLAEIEALAAKALAALPTGGKVGRRQLREVVAAALTVAVRNTLLDARAQVHTHDQLLRQTIAGMPKSVSAAQRDGLIQHLDRQRDALVQLTVALSGGAAPSREPSARP